MINIEPYSKTRSRSPSPTPVSTAAPSTEQTTSTSTSSSSLVPQPTKSTETTTDDISSVTNSLSTLTVTSCTSTTNTTTSSTTTTVADEEPKEELSPEEAKLRAQGLKSTHRPGFYIHINSPKRLRIQTSSKTFDLDRYCPHANADMLKWAVIQVWLAIVDGFLTTRHDPGPALGLCAVSDCCYFLCAISRHDYFAPLGSQSLCSFDADPGPYAYFCVDLLLHGRWNLCLFDAGHRGYSCVYPYDFLAPQDFSTSESPLSGLPFYLYLCDVIEKWTVRGWSPGG
ncbi:hypothetical protein BGZ97_003383 [Linnemannia gamsii]|uniref:Uncharacterized protein n=1 Tax=Linnemannia gamsii TaxID=64522 RepID=A0A9P6QVQ6_9FUNG|nr:hypothetical protein BGZ97_003383 [Linnemannia gamsii]